MRKNTWIVRPELDDRPYYMWDARLRQTVVVEELPERYSVEYIGISHAWGRSTEVKPLAKIPGVPRPAPRNTKFDVEQLPGHLMPEPHSGFRPHTTFNGYTAPFSISSFSRSAASVSYLSAGSGCFSGGMSVNGVPQHCHMHNDELKLSPQTQGSRGERWKQRGWGPHQEGLDADVRGRTGRAGSRAKVA